jgi:hypothetical protein
MLAGIYCTDKPSSIHVKNLSSKKKKNVIHGYLEDGCKMNTILNYPPHFMNVNHKNMIEMVNFCRYLF